MLRTPLTVSTKQSEQWERYESLNSQSPPTSRHTSSSKTPPESPQTASSTGDRVFKCLRLWGTSLIQITTVEIEWRWKRVFQDHIRRTGRSGQLRDYCSNQAKGRGDCSMMTWRQQWEWWGVRCFECKALQKGFPNSLRYFTIRLTFKHFNSHVGLTKNSCYS